MMIRNVSARRTMMIRPLIVMLIATGAFFAGYLIGMFHTMYYIVTDDKAHHLKEKEKVITFTHKVGGA
jgi:hypothetical protein